MAEWLAGMTTAGYLEHDAVASTFRLPDEHAYLLASEGSDHFMGGLFLMAPVMLGAAPKVAEAFRHGGGVTLDDLGPDGVEALDWLNCGQYEARFTSQWLAALPDVVAKLAAGGRILDVGCGVGRVAVAMRAGDSIADNTHALGTVFYGFSLFHCLTQSLANDGAGLGTCLGPAGTTALMRRAGFTRVEHLPIRSQTQHFYAARG